MRYSESGAGSVILYGLQNHTVPAGIREPRSGAGPGSYLARAPESGRGLGSRDQGSGPGSPAPARDSAGIWIWDPVRDPGFDISSRIPHGIQDPGAGPEFGIRGVLRDSGSCRRPGISHGVQNLALDSGSGVRCGIREVAPESGTGVGIWYPLRGPVDPGSVKGSGHTAFEFRDPLWDLALYRKAGAGFGTAGSGI